MDIGIWIRDAINNGQAIESQIEWSTIKYSYYFGPRIRDTYELVAGCRHFNTFAAFRAHYKDRHWLEQRTPAYGHDDAIQHRREALVVLDKMEAFAKAHHIPMDVEPKQRRKPPAKRKPKARKRR